MAIIYETGPAYIYASLPTRTMINSGTGLPAALTYPSLGSIYFLGTCDNVPTLDDSPIWAPVQNDVTGQMQSYDVEYQGRVGRLTGTLNRWNEYPFTFLDRDVDWGNAGTRGKDVFGDIAALAIQEGNTFHCWVDYPYSALKYSGFNLPRGYHFPAARMLPRQLRPGTTKYTRLFPMEALGVYNPTDGSILYYDHTFTNIPTIPPIAVSGLVS